MAATIDYYCRRFEAQIVKCCPLFYKTSVRCCWEIIVTKGQSTRTAQFP